MLRQAVHRARWYQHVARKRPFFPSPRAFSITPCAFHWGGPNDKVNFYEQDTAKSIKRRKIDPEADNVTDRKMMEEKLSKLDNELEILKEGPFGPNSPFIQGLPEKDREVALEALRKYEAKHGKAEVDDGMDEIFDDELDDMLKEEFEGLAMEEENWNQQTDDDPSGQASGLISNDLQSHAYVAKLNEYVMRFIQDDSDERVRNQLWKWYRRCKHVVPQFLDSLPEETIQLLWNSQARVLTKSSQTPHIQILAADALSAGKSLSTPNILSYIKSLHDTGKTRDALDQWEARQAELCQRKEDLEAYWRLGVRLFAAENDPQRAQDIALAFLANDESRQPRILIPVITAWAVQPGKVAEVRAWALYLQLKAFLRNNMTMEDYDSVSIGLLKAGRPNLAIAVFKDMMVTGKDPANDSTSLYRAAVGLAGNLQASSISEHDVNKISLATLTVLPRRFENRFFYASWMKKLIGMGEVDSAAMVVELMYERGVKPDPKHLNGLMAGWLRASNADAREKAERLGWAMVQQRIDSVWERINSPGGSPRLRTLNQDPDVQDRIPRWMLRSTPGANIETFSILLLHYTRRGDDDMIKYLVKCLGDAHIRPNSYFMNHLLYAELRKQDIGSLWNKYQTMSASILPDLETFACLWDCGKLQYDRGRTTFVASFPPARKLYAEMMTWFSHLSVRGQSVAREEFSKDFYDQIIRCFCLSKDLPGTLVALHSMRSIFGIAPDETTARLIILQVARLAGVPADTPKRRLRRLSSTPKSKENIGHVKRLVEVLSERKVSTLQAHGLSYDALEPAEREQYQLEIMVDLLRIVISRASGKTDPEFGAAQVEEKIAAAASDMRVEGVDLGSSLVDGVLPF